MNVSELYECSVTNVPLCLDEAKGHSKANACLMAFFATAECDIAVVGRWARYCLDLCFVCQVSLWSCQRQLTEAKLSLTQPQ